MYPYKHLYTQTKYMHGYSHINKHTLYLFIFFFFPAFRKEISTKTQYKDKNFTFTRKYIYFWSVWTCILPPSEQLVSDTYTCKNMECFFF